METRRQTAKPAKLEVAIIELPLGVVAGGSGAAVVGVAGAAVVGVAGAAVVVLAGGAVGFAGSGVVTASVVSFAGAAVGSSPLHKATKATKTRTENILIVEIIAAPIAGSPSFILVTSARRSEKTRIINYVSGTPIPSQTISYPFLVVLWTNLLFFIGDLEETIFFGEERSDL